MSLSVEVVPEKCVAVRRGRTCVAASWFGPFVRRPYVYPFLGPDDRELVRLGHPEDPIGHSHHRGIWIAHHDVAGVDFWSEAPGTGTIVQTGVEVESRSGATVAFSIECSWRAPDGQELLEERRRLEFSDLGGGELALDVDTRLQAAGRRITLGKTNFGLLGVRVARTMRVHEGLGGLVVNSNEGENETGCFGQHADWLDYSGPVHRTGVPVDPDFAGRRPESPLPARLVGIACFDHPENSPNDTLWHVRDDGWFGPGISRDVPRTLEPDAILRARYRIEAHAGRPWTADIGARYRRWRAARGA